MERRDFFQELFGKSLEKSGLARWLKTTKTYDSSELEARLLRDEDFLELVKNRVAIRSGEALTLNGEPFATKVNDLLIIERENPLAEAQGETAHLVLLAAHESDGLSVFEWCNGKHQISSYINLRIGAKTPVAVVESQSEESGAFSVTHLISASAHSGFVQAIQSDGNVLDLNPENGVFFRRRSSEGLYPAVPWHQLADGSRFLVRVSASCRYAAVAYVNASGASSISILN